ncbi:aromatic ring-hydroxylating dioxygenase subunit alpha [Cobetia sp. 1CM21F]|uniref:aromatic ring-hydroxylating oxygenase subunit alpha n=1 Tax=Cobetia sp. 1CM21F TaxID=2929163 RepID=UPI0020BF551A|nr:aromatic ring-hydroxylating dioxygenase subunit alpha [Cobetia sp. 1CM21F]MCK8067010.1 aromatic ring-hydroxylating dioxygenase subunit alpha [Cobetia sp. 1CM21F]
MSRLTTELLSRRQPGHALERAFYTDLEIFRQDLEQVHYKEWLFVAPACELPGRGSYLTYRIGEYHIVVIRGDDDEIRAFHNTCRHRGSVLCKTDKGKTPKLVCPYHQWTYDLDGTLQWARDMGPDFALEDHGLIAVHCRTISGLIHVCLADEAPDIASYIEVATPYLAAHDLDNAKVAFESRVIENGNWKLVWENNRECYHCCANHPSLIRTFPEDPRISFIGEHEVPDFIADHFAACEAEGLASRYVVAQNGQFRLSRMPLVEGAKSFTLDGSSGVHGKRLGQVHKEDAGVLNQFHYPSTWAYFLPDHCMTFRVTPISPTETELVTCWLVHKDAVEGVDYDLEHLTRVWLNTNSEDRRVVEDNQQGVNSRGYVPGPYSPVHEASVQGFVDWYCETLGPRLIPLRAVAS